ncbi:carboxylesterase/lipase family protein [Actinophytocola oryzae]|nr:carboxylesterase family protein [Actinophytocola oryzae]
MAEFDVRTAAGTVRGRVEDGLTVFRGIPFAEPPVGELRFLAPEPARAWDGVREAFEFGPPPPQDMGSLGRPGAIVAAEGDDWLTVNVWTPDPAGRRPVLVWIYGGAYRLGFSGSPGYDARHIARDGDLVVVSFNYRLGIEGFTQIEGAPANRGLLDQVAALEWVRDNIAAFGGDPGQVTIVGESAGAGAVAALLAMPSAAGLFRRAVAQSVPGVFLSPELGADITTAIAAELDLAPTVADLSTVDPRELTGAGAAMSANIIRHAGRWGQVAYSLSPFAPVVDGEVLPTTPWAALAAGAARDVELVVGHNRDEYRLFIALAGQLGKIGAEDAELALRVYGPGGDYRAAFPDASAARLYELVHSDWLFRMPTLRLAQEQAAAGGRAFMYELTWQSSGMGGELGACHGLDGPLLFRTFDAHLGPLLIDPAAPEEAEALSARFRGAWTAFVATGDPGWPAYDDDQRLVQVFDTPSEVVPYPEETSRRLWEAHTFGALPLLQG